MLPKHPLVAYTALAVSMTCHILALFLYLLRYDAGPSFTPVDVQVLILGVLLLIGVVISLYTNSRSAFRIIMAVRLGLYIVLCLPFQTWFDIRLLLLVALCFEIGIYEPFPINLIGQAIAILSSFTLLDVGWAIERGWSTTAISHAIQLLLIPVISGISVSLVTLYREGLLNECTTTTRLNQAVSQLSRSNVLLQDAAFRAEERSRSSERHRVAREIHDTVGYTMTNLIMMMEAATDIVFDYPEELQRIMQAAREQAKSGLEETRRSLRELREYEEPRLRGLKAIGRLVSTYDNVTWVNVEVEYGNAPMSFGEEIDSVLFHFVQEGLTNALRHGQATNIRIAFWIVDRLLRVSIRDNGMGASKINMGIGLAGMRERTERLDGSVDARNVDDGFQLTLNLPLGGGTDGEDTRAVGG